MCGSVLRYILAIAYITRSDWYSVIGSVTAVLLMNDDVSVISYSFGVYDWLLLHNSSWHAYVYLLYFFYILSLKLDISRSLLRIFMVNHEDTFARCEKY